MESTEKTPFKWSNWFLIEWNRPLGRPECPYMFRWIFMFFGYSIRVHHWLRSDDKRYMHCHPSWFWTFVVKGSYRDLTPDGSEVLKAGNIRFREATHTHSVEVLIPHTWTICLFGPKTRNWLFYVNGRTFRPLRFFSRYGHPPCTKP